MPAGLFVERDGVLVAREGALDPARVRLLPGVGAAIRRLALRGVAVVVVTDQPALGRGEVTAAGYAAADVRLRELLAGEGADLAGIHVCPAAGPDPRRKPRPGGILAAASAHGVDLATSWFVGAHGDDARAAAQAGCAGAVLIDAALQPGEDLGIVVAIAHDLADAPRVMIPRNGGCWHDRP